MAGHIANRVPLPWRCEQEAMSDQNPRPAASYTTGSSPKSAVGGWQGTPTTPAWYTGLAIW